MIIMFAVGFVIFAVYIYALLRAIYWGHTKQREEMLNDPELRNYYSRHGQGDFIDYDGIGNQGRFLAEATSLVPRYIVLLRARGSASGLLLHNSM